MLKFEGQNPHSSKMDDFKCTEYIVLKLLWYLAAVVVEKCSSLISEFYQNESSF